jgi:uncharacterized protein (TIGR04141 family)
LFGKNVRGGTSFRIEVPLSKLQAVLRRALNLFASNAYKKHWPEIDNLSPLKDETLIKKLEAQLDADFASGVAQKRLVMFTPIYRREEVPPVDSYVFGRLAGASPATPYLMVESWINFLKRKNLAPSVAEAKATSIHLLDEAREQIKVSSAFDCFGYELTFGGQPYILSSGVWYEVVLEFLTKINRAAANIPAPGTSLPPWDGVESEGEYNVRCGGLNGFLNFDTKNIMYGG